MYKNNKKGFSVIELLAVIVIVGLLVAIAIPVVNKQLNNFRESYYSKLENSIKSASQDYIADKRFAKPTKLLHSRIINVSDLEDEKYIDEVKDYLGNYCDSSDESYSYVVVVKTGEKTYDYQTCLKCSNDEYATDTSGEENDYCNPAWLNTDDVEYEYSYDDSFMYVYYGTSEDKIKEQVGLTYNVVKKDSKGKVLAKVEPSGEENDIVYPQNINELVGANLNSVITLRYEIPDGEVVTKKAVIYKHNAPQVVMTYAANNVVTGKNSGDNYGNGVDEWTSKLQVKITFSNSDLPEILNNVSVKGAEYFDEATRTWIDTGCSASGKTCTWTIEDNFDKDIKIRLVNEHNQKSDPSIEYTVNVDKTQPTCVSNDGNTTWAKNKTVNVVCGDNLSGCSQGSFAKTYPTATIKNKKTDQITIYDKAGNSNSCDVNFYVDSTNPSSCTVTMKNSGGTTISSGSTSTTDVTFDVTGVDNATDDSGIKTETWVVKEGSNSYNNLVNTNDKSNGTYSVVGTCTDNAGNVTTSTTSTVILDKSVTITFDKNTGSGTMSDKTCKYNVACTLTTNSYTKTGYTFTGWNTKSDGTGTSYSDGGSVTTKSSIILYAQWRANKVLVYYNANGATPSNATTSDGTYYYNKLVSSSDTRLIHSTSSSSTAVYYQTYTYDATAKDLINASTFGLTKTGYSFGGWYLNSSGTGTKFTQSDNYNAVDLSSAVETSDTTVTLYAKWNINKYTLTYDEKGGSSCTDKTGISYNNTWGDLCVPTKTGYTFGGWKTSSGTTITKDSKATADITVEAQWAANVYTITLNNQSATTAGSTAVYLKYNSGVYKEQAATNKITTSANNITVPKKTGHKFGGYYTSTNGGGTQLISASGYITSSFTNTYFSSNKTIYAKWTANTYKLTYDENGGSNCDDKTGISYNTAWGELCKPTKTGYTFNGWKTSSGTTITKDSIATADITVIAQWKANNCIVKYDKGSGPSTIANLPSQQSVNPGSTMYVSSLIPSATNYGFVGWTYNNKTYAPGSSLGTCSSGTITLTASWNSSFGKYPDIKVNVGDKNGQKDWATVGGTTGLTSIKSLNYQDQTSTNVCEISLTNHSAKKIPCSDSYRWKIKVYLYSSSESYYQIQWCTGTDPSTQCREADIAEFKGVSGDYHENGGNYINNKGYWGTGTEAIGHQVSYQNGVSGYFRMRARQGKTKYSDWSPIYSSNWNCGSGDNFTSFCS